MVDVSDFMHATDSIRPIQSSSFGLNIRYRNILARKSLNLHSYARRLVMYLIQDDPVWTRRIWIREAIVALEVVLRPKLFPL